MLLLCVFQIVLFLIQSILPCHKYLTTVQITGHITIVLQVAKISRDAHSLSLYISSRSHIFKNQTDKISAPSNISGRMQGIPASQSYRRHHKC